MHAADVERLADLERLADRELGPSALPSLETAEADGWRAHLTLRLGPRHGRTSVIERRHVGPLVIQRPFYPERNGCCHLYVVHPPGGVVGGDELRLDVDLERGAHALVTTPAATKLYRSNGKTARVHQQFSVRGDAVLEWLPQETIAFDGSDAVLSTRVELEPGAAFVGSEVVCLGRPAAQEAFRRGALRQRFELRRAARPCLIEQLWLSGSGAELYEPWGLGGRSTFGTLVATSGAEPTVWASKLPSLIGRLRATLEGCVGIAAVTHVSDVLICRYLGDGASHAQAVLRRAWELVRPELTDCQAVAPRIWAT